MIGARPCCAVEAAVIATGWRACEPGALRGLISSYLPACCSTAAPSWR